MNIESVQYVTLGFIFGPDPTEQNILKRREKKRVSCTMGYNDCVYTYCEVQCKSV